MTEAYSLNPQFAFEFTWISRTVEALRDHNRPKKRFVLRNPAKIQEMVDYKWSLNYFLEKWLSHCLDHGYQFKLDDAKSAHSFELTENLRIDSA